MIKRTFLCWAICCSILFLCARNGLAYDEKVTHPELTKIAIKISILDQYLKSNLSFKDGIQAKVPSYSADDILVLLRKGAELEDFEPCRRANHFHNPLLPWGQSGMSDDPLWAESGCTFWTRYSAVTWGTGYLSPAPGGGKQAFPQWPDIREPNTWDNARKYCYLALT